MGAGALALSRHTFCQVREPRQPVSGPTTHQPGGERMATSPSASSAFRDGPPDLSRAQGSHVSALNCPSMPENPMRVILLANCRTRLIWRLAQRIEQEAMGTRVCGVLYQPPCSPPRGTRERIHAAAVSLADLALRWMHACPRNPNGDCR